MPAAEQSTGSPASVSPASGAPQRSAAAPKALVVRTAGTNCDAEMCAGFAQAGAQPELIHLDALIAAPQTIEQYELIGFPGGFSYGDDIASGRIFAVRLKNRLWPALRAAAARGVPMIAVCNGFQVIVQAGLLPGPHTGDATAGQWPATPPAQEVSLQHNSGGRFIGAWVPVAYPKSACLWTAGLADAYAATGLAADAMLLPIAHGEGRFVTGDAGILPRLQDAGQIAVTYGTDVNGSEGAVAGICDATGRIFGLMPHPERFLQWNRHPYWTRLPQSLRALPTPGMMMFRNAVAAAVSVR